MRHLFIILSVLFSTNILAESRVQILNNIERLSRRISIVAAESTLSNDELRSVQNGLKGLLNHLGGNGNKDCIDFTKEIYERFYTRQTALDKAKRACENISDVDVTRFVYAVYAQRYTQRTALDKAVLATGSRLLSGKAEELGIIYDVYNESYTSSYAVDLALEEARKLPRFSASCLESAYRTFSRSYTSKYAMDKAIETCKR